MSSSNGQTVHSVTKSSVKSTNSVSLANTNQSAIAKRGQALKPFHVNFGVAQPVCERKTKYLTAKYGQHQMNLIKKRLSVEMWLFGQLQELYQDNSTPNKQTAEVDIDFDEIIDLEDGKRREVLQVS